VTDSFRWECLNLDYLYFWWIRKPVRIAVGQQSQIARFKEDSLSVSAKKAPSSDDKVKAWAIFNRKSQSPRRSQITAGVEAPFQSQTLQNIV